MTTAAGLSSICLIGFGEVGQTLARDLAGARLSAWDIAFDRLDSSPSRAAGTCEVRVGRDAADAVRGSELVISAVTAAQDIAAARSAAAGIAPGAWFLDLNSCSPGQKRASFAVIEAAGGRYVEAAVMSPIAPKRIASPMLLGGPHAAAFEPVAQALGFSGAKAYSEAVGTAAATKLCRSVIVKGMEALLLESMLAARRYGVEDVVLASLQDLLPQPDWPEKARYMISRAVEHGVRRAEEMREAARTVEEVGVAPLMSRAIAERQDWAAQFQAALAEPDLAGLVDAIDPA